MNRPKLYYPAPSGVVSSGPMTQQGNVGDWNIETVQTDRNTLHIIFSHYQAQVGWRQIFNIPVANPMPFSQTSWPIYDQTSKQTTRSYTQGTQIWH